MSVVPPQATSGLSLGRSASHQRRTQCAETAGSHSWGETHPALASSYLQGLPAPDPNVWDLMVGSSGIRCPGLGSQPHHILSVLCQVVCEPLWALVSFSVK